MLFSTFPSSRGDENWGSRAGGTCETCYMRSAWAGRWQKPNSISIPLFWMGAWIVPVVFLTQAYDPGRAGSLEAWQFQFYRRGRSIWLEPSRAVGWYQCLCQGPCSRSIEPRVEWLTFWISNIVWPDWLLPSHLDLRCVVQGEANLDIHCHVLSCDWQERQI